MEQTKTAKKIYLPNEIWFKIFHYVKVKDTLQLSLVCHDFMNLVKNNSLWRHYCRRASNTLKLNEINMFPSCKDLYRDILQPFAWALGHTFKLPGTGKVGKVRLQDRALVITPTREQTRDQVFLRIRSEEGERKIEKLINETGRMEEIYKVEDAQKFIQQNVVVYFFDRYMRVDSKLLRSCR